MHRNSQDTDGLQLVFDAPCQLQSLAALEHGRTILLVDTARNLGLFARAASGWG